MRQFCGILLILPFWHLLIQAYYFIVSFVGGTLPGIVSTSQNEWASLVAEAEAPASVLDFADASICVQFYSKSTGHFEHSYVQPIYLERLELDAEEEAELATVYKGNIIKNLIMDCQSYTKYRPNETTGGIFVSWRRKEELPTGA